MITAPTDTEPSPARGRTPPHHDRLGPLTDVNVLGLRWLADSARQGAMENSAFMKAHGDALAALTDARLHRLAVRVSLLLFDLHFRDTAWWMTHALRDSSGSAAAPREPENTPRVRLARSMLVLAWHTARADRDAALVMLGLSPSVADVISQLHLQDVDNLAARYDRDVAPRWPANVSIWTSILNPGVTRSDSTKQPLALQCLSLAAGEILQTS